MPVNFLRLFAALFLLFAALPADAAAKIERVISPGGIEAWLVREPNIPMISVDVAWRGGSAMDPAGREGMAQFAANLLDEGAADLDSQAFRAALEDRAITMSFSAETDSMRASTRMLVAQREEAFRLLGLALTKPRLDAEPFERTRQQMLVDVERASTEPNSMASRTWASLAFPDHAYGRPRQGTRESLTAITRDDVLGLLQQRLARDNLVIGVVGDIVPADLARLLDATFGVLPAKSVPDTLADVVPASAAAPVVVAREGPQSVVRFSLPGVKRKDPDYYAAYLLNYVLGGGGFSSRLMDEVREKRGLVYGISTSIQPSDHAGVLVGGLASRNDQVAPAIKLVRQEIERLHDKGITAKELADARDYVIGAFPVQLTSNSRIAGIMVSIQLQGLGIDYIDRYSSTIRAVTLADVNRVARRLLDPAKLLTVVVGQPVGLGG